MGSSADRVARRSLQLAAAKTLREPERLAPAELTGDATQIAGEDEDAIAVTRVDQRHLDAEPSARASPGKPRERGDVIGRYVLLSELGKGGMGVVWAAYDPELDRRLALKLLRRGGSSERLLREAQALARMAHPNIVAVHDVGEDRGDVWLAMELVSGETLKTWLEAHPGRSWREVLRAVLPAGWGVCAAHEAGLIHRDLKPENMMMGDDGRIRVMDFGLARAGEIDESPTSAVDDPLASQVSLLSSSVTRVGAFVGTPAYMSPEQYSGLVDERTDVFAFSVVLWEALCGARPFEADNIVALICAINQGDLHEPARARKIPRWLRRALRRGLAGDVNARWQSMRELVGAIERGLRRERWRLVAVTAAATAALGLGAYGWHLYDQEQRAQACAQEAEGLDALWPARAEALRAGIVSTGLGNTAETMTRLVPLLDDWVTGWSAAREHLCVAATVERTLDAELAARARECSELHRSDLTALLELLIAGEATVVLQAVGAASHLPAPGDCADPEKLQLIARPGAEVREAASALRKRISRARAMQSVGKYVEGLLAAEAALAEAQTLDWPPLLASAELTTGVLLQRNGRFDESEQHLRRAFRLSVESGDDEHTTEAIYYLGLVAHDLSAPARGLVWTEMAEALLARRDPGHRSRESSILGVRAILHQDLGELSTAAELYDEAVALDEQRYGRDSLQGAVNLNNLALLRSKLGDIEEARAIHERVEAIRVATLGPNHPKVAASMLNRGLTYLDNGDPATARELFERALAIHERTYGGDNPRMAGVLNMLAVALAKLEDFEGAIEVGARALAIREATFGPDHPQVAASLNNHAITLQGQGRYDEARALHERALAIRVKHFGETNNEVARSHTNLGEIALEVRHVQEAIDHLERAVTIRESIEVSPQLLAYSRFALARALAERAGDGDRGRARELAAQARAAYAAADNPRAQEIEAWLAAREKPARRPSRRRR